MIFERHREIPARDLIGPPVIGQDLMSDADQLRRINPGARFCFGVAHIRLSYGEGRWETVFISPLSPTKEGAATWQSENAAIINDYLAGNTPSIVKPRISIEEVHDGDIYTRRKQPEGKEKSLTHGRHGTPTASADGMRCISSSGKPQRRHR